VCATASDLIAWQAALDGGRVIGAASLAEMRAPTVLRDGTRIDYGLGTRLGSLQGHRAVGHTGGGGGFDGMMIDFPDDHVTVVVLTNSGGAFAIATAVARVALGLSPPVPRDTPLSAAEAAALPGRFDSDEGAIEQVVRGGNLRFRVPGETDDHPLYRQADGVFAADQDTVLRVPLRDGRVDWGFLYVGGLMVDAKVRVAGTR
jgi:CubicO group peptidase (beta-lactamase class C family)